MASGTASRSKNERWTPCPAEKAANYLIFVGRYARPSCVHAWACGNGVIGARKAGARSAPLRGIANPSDEPHAQRRNRRSAGLHAIWAVPPIRLRIRAMEPMPSGGIGSRDVEVSARKIRETTLRKRLPRPRKREPCRSLLATALFSDLSTMSKITLGAYEQNTNMSSHMTPQAGGLSAALSSVIGAGRPWPWRCRGRRGPRHRRPRASGRPGRRCRPCACRGSARAAGGPDVRT